MPVSSDGAAFAGLTFSPDASLLAADANGRVDVWDVATGKHAITLTGSDSQGYAGLAFSPDGKLLAVASSGGDIYVRLISQLVA